MLGRTSLFLAAAVVLSGVSTTAGLAGGTSPSNRARRSTTTAEVASITPPAEIAKAGQIVFCSDITFPPEEYYRGSTPVGSDIDIAHDVAARFGVKAVFQNTSFDGIIPALLSKKCDAIISGMNHTPERAKQVGFIDYLSVGQALMVAKGNPQHITSFLTLCGHDGAAQLGSANLDELKHAATQCKKAGKPAIHVLAFKADTDGAAALQAGKIDAYETDAPVVAYYIKQAPAVFEFGASNIHAQPAAIAVRKDDPQLKTAINKAIRAAYATGTMKKILSRWNMSAFALKH